MCLPRWAASVGSLLFSQEVSETGDSAALATLGTRASQHLLRVLGFSVCLVCTCYEVECVECVECRSPVSPVEIVQGYVLANTRKVITYVWSHLMECVPVKVLILFANIDFSWRKCLESSSGQSHWEPLCCCQCGIWCFDRFYVFCIWKRNILKNLLM